jgi:hypothetical protein
MCTDHVQDCRQVRVSIGAEILPNVDQEHATSMHVGMDMVPCGMGWASDSTAKPHMLHVLHAEKDIKSLQPAGP